MAGFGSDLDNAAQKAQNSGFKNIGIIPGACSLWKSPIEGEVKEDLLNKIRSIGGDYVTIKAATSHEDIGEDQKAFEKFSEIFEMEDADCTIQSTMKPVKLY